MTVRLPESPKRCPMDALLRLMKGHWTPYIIWTLGGAGPLRFGAIRRQVAGISAKVLTERLRMLEGSGLVYRHYEQTIPPRVSYGLTERGRDLIGALDLLNAIACRWQADGEIRAGNAEGTGTSTHFRN